MKEKIKIIKGDITKQETEAIVNAANRTLLGGGGVDGAIHRAAGKGLLLECMTLNGCETGKAKITKGYNLKAKYVIHAVGPVWNGGTRGEEKLLAGCYANSLRLALEHRIESISFPAISTGVYGYPPDKAVKVAVSETLKFLRENPDFREVVFVCFDEHTYRLYEAEMNQI
ncbi:MAG: O-acetyl-ADP-ribose deacetylase [Bacteroidetes bacterium]|nr:O-acetyl-ADP-ribose deacetylase [Bacteroidota bacterium]